jgi:transposase
MPPTVSASLERLLKALEEELATLEKALAQQVEQHAELQARQRQLQTICGIGLRVSLPLLVAFERFQTLVGRAGTPLEAQAVVAYMGLDPKPYQSGTSVQGSALIARQGDRLVAAARKLVVWAWAVFTSGQDFDTTKCAHNAA